MIDLVEMKKAMPRYMQDLRTAKRIVRGLSDHYVVLCKVSLRGGYELRRER